MLISEFQERGRKLKLALRVGVPILLLVAILLATIAPEKNFYTLANSYILLIVAIVLVIIYFIYSQFTKDSKETLLDRNTQAYNISAFKKHIKKSNTKSIGILVIGNLDHINEQYGVEKTDEMLQNVVQRLDDYSEIEGMHKNIIGRYSGSEFLIGSPSDSKHLDTTIEGFITENITVNNIDVDYKFAVSSSVNLGFNKIVSVLKDKIKAKETYANKVEYNRPPEPITDKTDMDRIVGDALRDKSLNFYFKPIINLQTGSVEIFKVGVKMLHNNEEILPKVYLPVISKLGYGREYDYLVLEYLSLFLLLVDEKISFSFNLSATSIRDKEFRKKVSELMQNNVKASRLIIEQYERKKYPDLNDYISSLNYMHKEGFKIAIDNFGSTNASVEHMRYFEFDFVEFDSDYVKKLDNDITLSMFESLLGVTKTLNVKSIAKWVDNDSQKLKLKEIGVNYAQGFGVGESISEDELLALYG